MPYLPCIVWSCWVYRTEWKIFSVLWGFFSLLPIDSYPCKICPSHPHKTNSKQTNTTLRASLGLTGGVLPAHVVVGSSRDVPFTVRFWTERGEHILWMGTSLSRLTSPSLFGQGPGQTCFIMSSAGEWGGLETWSSGFMFFDILTVPSKCPSLGLTWHSPV